MLTATSSRPLARAQKDPAAGAMRGRLDLWVAALLFAAALVLRLAVGPAIIDDAYITFRYARNAAEGLGLVYNEGEHVLGVTTPLWLLVLTAIAKLGLDLPTASFVLGALGDAAVPPVLFLIGRSLRWPILVAVVSPIAYGVHPFAVHMAVSGMETGVFMILIVASGWFYVKERATLAVGAGALSALTRPEGLAMLGAMLIHLAWRQRSLPIRQVLLALLLLAPWGIFSLLYYGSPIPQSILAKNSAYQNYLELSLHHIHVVLEQTLWFPMRLFGLGVALPVALFFTLAPLALVFGRTRLLPIVLFHAAILAELIFIAASGHLVFPWYLLPGLVGILLGVPAMLNYLRIPQATAALTALVFFGSAWTGWTGIDHGLLPVSPVWINEDRQDAYREVARLLRTRLDQHTLLLSNEIGVLGYELPVHILDPIGLVSPEATKYHGSSGLYHDLPPALLPDLQPDYVVALEIFIHTTLETDADFNERYELLAAVTGPALAGYDRVLVFQRKR